MWVTTPSQPFRHTRQTSYATSPYTGEACGRSKVSLRLGHARWKTIINRFLTPSRHFVTLPYGYKLFCFTADSLVGLNGSPWTSTPTRCPSLQARPWSSRIVGREACSRRKNISINQGKSESHPERRTKSAVEHGVRHEVSGSLIDRLSQTPHPSRFTRHLVSLRLGHGSALTVVQTVIHSLADASLPAGEGLQRTVGTPVPTRCKPFRFATDYLAVANGQSGRLSLRVGSRTSSFAQDDALMPFCFRPTPNNLKIIKIWKPV